MSKNYHKCPRCGNKTPNTFPKCGVCGLNFAKFATATNGEAKSAIRMGERERIVNATTPPSDINKMEILIMAIFGGWFGLPYFKVGRYVRGAYQAIAFVLGMVYCAYRASHQLVGFLGNAILLGGILWAVSVILWVADVIAIIFNRFKYPVSLPYSEEKVKKENKGITSASDKGE